MENKHHYRKVFKSDHLGTADLEDMIEEKKSLSFTIKEVKQYTLTQDKNSGIVVAGKRINANIAYFVEPIKPLVLNSTNSKIVKSFNGGSPFVEDWANTPVTLYIDASVKMKGDVVGGVRINPTQPKGKETLTPDHEKWAGVITKLQAGGSIAKVEQYFNLSDENKTKLMEAAI